MARFSIYKVYVPMHDGLVVMGWRAVQFPGSLQVVQAYWWDVAFSSNVGSIFCVAVQYELWLAVLSGAM